MPAKNSKDSRRAEKLRLAAEKRRRDRDLVFGGSADDAPEDSRNGWIPRLADEYGLVFNGLVHWGQGLERRQTGVKYLDYSADRWKGHLVVLFFGGHTWTDRYSVFRPFVSESQGPEADLACYTLRQACVLNHEFEMQGFGA